MLNKIINTLNGHGSEAASLEAALLQLGRDRDETRVRIVELKRQRHAELLDDASDAAIGKIDLAIDRAEVKLEKLNAAEPPLLEKLTGARTAARQRRWHELRETYRGAAVKFLASARVAIENHTALIAIVDHAQREGFSGEVAATMPATPNIEGSPLLAPDLLDIFERVVTPPAAPARRAAKAAAPKPIQLPGERPEGSLQHAIALDGGVPIPIEALTAKRAAHDRTPLASGEVRAKVLRSGYSPADDRPQCYRGQVIRLPRVTAERASAAGVLEIFTEEPKPREQLEERPAGSLQHPVHVSSAGTAAAAKASTQEGE